MYFKLQINYSCRNNAQEKNAIVFKKIHNKYDFDK